MRVKKTLKNSVYAIVSFAGIAVLTILVRKCFIQTLGLEALGYEGLFGNIFQLLSLADMGIANMIAYRMYAAFARQDEAEITKLLSVYAKMYRFVGVFIFVISILLMPLLRYIIRDNSYDWNYLYIIYLFQVAASVCTYFFAYKRIVLVTSLKEAECIKIDTVCTTALSLLQALTLFLFKSYILFLSLKIVSNIVANGIIAHKVNKEYAFARQTEKVDLADVKDMELLRDIKNNFIQKVCLSVYSGTDSIIISALLGIAQVGLMANYLLISSYVSVFLNKLFKPFQAAIGNYNYSADKERGTTLFRMFDLFSFCMASFVFVAYLVMLNPFIELIFGSEYLLNQSFVIAFALNSYFGINSFFVNIYRDTFGSYEKDRNPIVLGTILNITLSLLLAKPLGLVGILIGTIVGQFGFWFGRVRVVYSEYIKEGVNKYAIRQAARLALLGVETAGVWYLSKFVVTRIGNPYVSQIANAMICLSVVSIVIFVAFGKSTEAALARQYFAQIVGGRRKGDQGE